MELYEKIIELQQNNKAFVIVSVVKVEGSVPGKVGFKMIVEGNGNTFGTVGGGAIEQKAKEEALKFIIEGNSSLKEYLLSDSIQSQDSKVEVIPMSCSGKVWIYYEVHGSLPTVYIFGGGHVGQALLHYLKPLNYHTVLIDNREEFANNSNASMSINSDYEKFAKEFTPAPNAYYVILTHGHIHDYTIAKELFSRKIDMEYIGIIGSKSKAKKLKENLINDLGSDLNLSNLFSPIGLNIGGNSPYEIAMSIAAQIQSIRYNLVKYA